MKRISSNSLFHFTSQTDHLINILENDFSPRICIEKLTPFTRSEIAIPMVSFCDIPLSQIELHSSQYGSYGIGLSKKWGKDKGISPVMYFHSKSNHIGPFMKAMKKYEKIAEKPNSDWKSYSDVMYSTWFYKPYEGKMWRANAYTEKKIRFYDEKEWRYIPTPDEMYCSEIGQYSYYDEDIDKIKNYQDFKKGINDDLSKCFKLKFKPDDIKYLIVKNESEILEMIHKLKTIKNKFSEDELDLLCSRIISMESIRNDF